MLGIRHLWSLERLRQSAQYKYWMRLFEFVLPPLYVGVNTRLRPGTTLLPCRDRSTRSRIELWLEKYRPDHCLPRASTLALSPTPEHQKSFIYSADPVGAYEKCHAGWHGLLAAETADSPRVEEFCRSYWSGCECFAHEGSWEYRTRKARISGPYAPT